MFFFQRNYSFMNYIVKEETAKFEKCEKAIQKFKKDCLMFKVDLKSSFYMYHVVWFVLTKWYR